MSQEILDIIGMVMFLVGYVAMSAGIIAFFATLVMLVSFNTKKGKEQ